MKPLQRAVIVSILVAAVVPASAQRRSQAAVSAEVERGVDSWQAGKPDDAVQIWRPLAIAGDADAQYNIAQAYRLGRGVPVDRAQAKDWYRRAAAQGHYPAQANYGLLLFEDGDQRAAIPWLQQAADHGDPRAQYVVGTALFNGDLLPKDWVRAYALMSRAAAAGLAPAQSSLTEMNRYLPLDQRQRGTALARDLERAQTAQNSPPPRPAGPIYPPVQSAVPRLRTPPPTPIQTTAIPPSSPARPVPSVAPSPASRPARPAPVQTAAAPRARPAGGAWRVQLGAFSSQAAARAQWDSLRSRSPALASFSPSFIPAGPIVRLQAGGFADRTAADRACGAAKAIGHPCFSVKP